MAISFSEVPESLRLPGAYIEIDGSQAGLGNDLPIVLLVGQKLESGSAPAGEIIRITSPFDAAKKAGKGSMLHDMATHYRKIDPTFDLFILPYADNSAGIAATGAITVSSAAYESGTLALYIAGKRVSVGIKSVDNANATAEAIAKAINKAEGIPATATFDNDKVSLTAIHKGSCGNGIDLRLSLFGEPAPQGLVLNISAMAGGAGDPETGNLEAIIGTRWFKYIALGINDKATLMAWHQESQRRYKVPIQAGFRAFTALRADFETACDFGQACNFEHMSTTMLGISPITPWQAAATITAAAAPRLWNTPTISLEGVPLPAMFADVSYNQFTQNNSLLFKGISVMEVGKDGACYIKRLISMYQTRSDGSADDAWLDINTAEVMERIRYDQRIGAIKRFRGSIAAKSNEGYRPGIKVVTADDVKTFLLSIYKLTFMQDRAWVQSYEYYKKSLIVEQDPTNPSRFNFRDDPVITSPFYILAGRSQFRKVEPAY